MHKKLSDVNSSASQYTENNVILLVKIHSISLVSSIQQASTSTSTSTWQASTSTSTSNEL